MNTLEEEIEKKEAEIENYKAILARNVHSRWYDQGRRHLEGLEAELVSLIHRREGED